MTKLPAPPSTIKVDMKAAHEAIALASLKSKMSKFVYIPTTKGK